MRCAHNGDKLTNQKQSVGQHCDSLMGAGDVLGGGGLLAAGTTAAATEEQLLMPGLTAPARLVCRSIWFEPGDAARGTGLEASNLLRMLATLGGVVLEGTRLSVGRRGSCVE